MSSNKTMLNDNELKQIRVEIDAIDNDILKLLAKRKVCCDTVGQHKLNAQLETRDLAREQQLLEQKLSAGRQLGLNEGFIHQLFDLIIEQSVRDQYQMKMLTEQPSQPLRVGYLGNTGSYSHQAAIHHYEQQTHRVTGYRSFKEIIDAVKQSQQDQGLLPIENTTSGSIHEVYDLIEDSGLSIVGEHVSLIDHCLLNFTESVDLEDVECVYGHPQAILQCSELFDQHSNWRIEYCSSSAAAIEQIIRNNDARYLSIGNQFAADVYGLNVVARNIGNQRENYTRFISVAREPVVFPSEIPSKTSILFTTGQSCGALADVLNIFKQHRIVINKLESRPIANKPWEELFYLDLDGHHESVAINTALKEIERLCSRLLILGCYPKYELEKPIIRQQATTGQ